MALAERLLLAASRLQEVAVEGVVELEAVQLKSALGLQKATLRTLRSLLAALEEKKVITRSSGRGPGAKLRLVLLGEKRKEKRKVAEGEAESSAKEAEVAETGKGRVGATQTLTAPKKSAAASPQASNAEKRKVAEERPGVAEGPRVVFHRHEHVVRLEPSPELLAILGMRVSHDKSTSPSAGASPAQPCKAPDEDFGTGGGGIGSGPAECVEIAPSKPQPDPQGLRPTPEQIKQAVAFRVEQQRPQGFKRSATALAKDLARKFNGDRWREVFEILDEKREIEEARHPAVGPPGPRAAPVEEWGSAKALEELRARERAKDAQSTKSRIQESRAALRVKT